MKTLKQMKIELLKRTLMASKNNKMKTARLLGVSIEWVRLWVRINPELVAFRTDPPSGIKKRLSRG